MYSLIEFPENYEQKAEVEVVPDIWLEKKDEKWYNCFWPQTTSTKQIRKAIEKRYLPEKNWANYNCRLLHTYDSYNEARKKLVNAEFTSTLESDAEVHQRPKRKVKKPFRFYSDSSESDNVENAVCNKIPSPPKLRTPTKSNTTVLPRTPIMTPCKSSTSTVASPKRLRIANDEMNYEKSFSSEKKLSKRSAYITSDYDSSRKINSPRRILSAAMNKSPLRQINLPIRSPTISQRCSSREVHPPQRSSSVAMNKSPLRQINTPRRSHIISQRCSSREVYPPQRSSNVSMNKSPLRQNNSSRCSSVISQRCSSREVHPPQRSSSTASTTSEFDKSDFSYLVLTKLASLENSMNLLLPMIKQLMAHFRLTNISHVENVPQIPVNSDDNLDNLETFMDIRENFEYMMNTLSLSGGTTIAQITRRTLEKLITNNYATNFNWAGRAPKKAFKCLKMKSLVVATVKSVEPNAAINLIENSIKDWLKLASVRTTLTETRKLNKTFQ